MAHVRRATVGKVALENTHPFRHAGWTFLHNGTVPYFAEIRDELLAELPAAHRAAIAGSTDSEHLFHLILASHEQAPERPLLAILQQALERVIRWCRARGQEPHLGLNVLLSDGAQMVGSRWQRSLHWCERLGRAACPVCGRPDAADATDSYRALLIASEPITRSAGRRCPSVRCSRSPRTCACASCRSARTDAAAHRSAIGSAAARWSGRRHARTCGPFLKSSWR